MKVKYSFWREVVMSMGVACLVVAGLIVGPQYFNKALSEIERVRLSDET